jgi:hypothetical protein
MATPIEIAGIALAVFPLVISALEHYAEGYATLESWRFHRLQFTSLISKLNQEKILFQQHIEGLLRSVNDSEFDVKKMMSDLDCDYWKSPGLTLRLKRKMPQDSEYETYKIGIQSIHDNLEKLAKRIERCRPPVGIRFFHR